jgi:hypothetical protein
MSGLDDDHHKGRPSSWRQKPRKSMDLEFHDLDLDSLDDELQYESLKSAGAGNKPPPGGTGTFKNGKLLLPNGTGNDVEDGGGDSDDDTFGEASDDCEPDQKYLDELLEEYHPERVNLLDHNIPPRISISDVGNDDDDDDDESYQKKTRRRNGLLSPRARRGGDCPSNQSVSRHSSDSDSDEDENDNPPPWSSSRLGSDAPPQRDDHEDASCDAEVAFVASKLAKDDRINGHDEDVPCGTTEDSSAQEESEEGMDNHHDDHAGNDDAFAGSPPRRRLKDQMDELGNAGKKSFRQVSTTFWAQPFKGLGRPKRRGKQAAVEEQEITS